MVTNGQIPASQLVAISGRAGARLLSGPAASWERVVAACADRYGWRPAPTGPSDAYRELAVQVATFLARYVPAKTGGGYYGDVRWWNGVRYARKAGTSAAAVPGTSNHGRGRAVDVTGLGGFGGTRYRQFAAVAVPLGWSNDEGESVDEPWHWVDLLSPETVASGHATWPGAPTPSDPTLRSPAALVPTHQGDAMFIAKSIQDGTFWLVGPGFCHALTTMAQVTPYQAGGLKTVELDNGDIGQIQAVSAAINTYTR